MMRFWIPLAAIALLGSELRAAEPIASHARRLESEARALSSQGDLQGASERFSQALGVVPNQPRFLLSLAALKVRMSDFTGARRLLERFAQLGLQLPPNAAPEISSFLQNVEVAALAERLHAPAVAKGAAKQRLLLSNTPIVAEGLAYDSSNGRLFISAVAAHVIFVEERDNPLHAFNQPGASLGGFFGMGMDTNRRRLWVSEASGPGIPGARAATSSTALLEFDAKSGDLIHRYAIAAGQGAHQLNDVAVARDDSVFTSDAVTGEIYRLGPGAKNLQLLVPPGHLRSAQGMVVTRDDKALIAADYATGLHRIELPGGQDELMSSRAAAALVGIDGLARCGGALIATQNGTDPERILRIELGPGERTIATVQVLAQAIPEVKSISLGTCARGRFVYIAHSQWDGYDADGERTSSPLEQPAVMTLDAAATEDTTPGNTAHEHINP